MNRIELANIVTDVIRPMGFKKKGNFWLLSGREINKMISLQKSQYSDRFYLNYGYVLNSIPLDGEMMHVLDGLGSAEPSENTRINELLDLENTIADEERKMQLRVIIQEILVARMRLVNTEDDLLAELKRRPHLNDIPLTVKRRLKLE